MSDVIDAAIDWPHIEAYLSQHGPSTAEEIAAAMAAPLDDVRAGLRGAVSIGLLRGGVPIARIDGASGYELAPSQAVPAPAPAPAPAPTRGALAIPAQRPAPEQRSGRVVLNEALVIDTLRRLGRPVTAAEAHAAAGVGDARCWVRNLSRLALQGRIGVARDPAASRTSRRCRYSVPAAGAPRAGAAPAPAAQTAPERTVAEPELAGLAPAPAEPELDRQVAAAAAPAPEVPAGLASAAPEQFACAVEPQFWVSAAGQLLIDFGPGERVTLSAGATTRLLHDLVACAGVIDR